MMKIFEIGKFVVLFWASVALADFSLYVSPDGDDIDGGEGPDRSVRTVQRAIELARRVQDKPVTVYLSDGVYEIREPLRFGVEDNRAEDCPLIVKPLGKNAPVISGGQKIIGWQKQANGMWTTQIDVVKEGKWYFTQLFVNGQRCQRAKSPNNGFFRVAGFPEGGRETDCFKKSQSFEFKPGDIKHDWQNLGDVEVIIYHFWTDTHLPVESVDAQKNIVSFKYKSGKVFTDDYTNNGARYIVENVYEELDIAGEWYLDRQTGVLSYMPKPGEDISTIDACAPLSPALVTMNGDAIGNNPLANIRFESIDFAYTNYFLPPGNCNDAQGSSSVPAAITLKGCSDIVFNNCTIRNIGTFAFDIGEGCRNVKMVGNQMVDLGGGGVRVNGGNESSHPLLRTGNNIIKNNIIGPYGTVYSSAVGVLLMHTFGNEVSHNEIHHGWYTGVSIGWHWGYQRSISRDNLIDYNHIHHIGQGLLSDMGAVYTLGISPGTKIRNNLIHDIDANHYGGWGIYNDEGSSHILVENNIVYNTKFAGYNIHYAKEITVRNNIFAFGRLQQLSRSRVEPHKSCFFENNIVYFTEGKLLDNRWRDKSYKFYYHPNHPEGRDTHSTFDMDWNIYYNPGKELENITFNGLSFSEWQKTGKDMHSLYLDPKFEDVDKYDFRLKNDSPALELGFKSIDMTTVGPENDEMLK